MRHLRHHLRACELFSDRSDQDLHRILAGMRYRIATFSAGQVVAMEGAPCSNLGIVLTGAVDAVRAQQAGNVLTLARLGPGAVFGEAVLFADCGVYPVTIMSARADSAVMFISHREIERMCRNEPGFFRDFARLLSRRILLLNDKIKLLSLRTIRRQVAGYLLDLHERMKTSTVVVPLSRQELADLLGVARPSLSRELMAMRDGGLIDFSRNVVTLKDIEGLRDCLSG